jgi:putative GTP pyrophosphokinase
LTNPKYTGYRGIHDVYSYFSEIHKDCNGTMIEVQYRTQHHHAWATANEVFTMLNPYQRTKFDQADADYMEFFRLTSEIFARVFDNMNSVYPNMTDEELLGNLSTINARIWMEEKLRNINVAKQHIKNATAILRFKSDGGLEIIPVPSFRKAMDFYFELEKEYPNDDVVLVNSKDASGIRSAYRNYFSDTTDFLSYLDYAKNVLTQSTLNLATM